MLHEIVLRKKKQPNNFSYLKTVLFRRCFLKLKVESKLVCICSSRYQLYLKSSLKVYRLMSKKE